MAYNPSLGLVDPFFGAEDLERKIIRTVGDPQVRFTEDALRIMRCVRFAASLGFDIEEQTSLALLEKSELLEKISGERIFIELTKLLESEHAYSVIHDYPDVLVKVLPPLTEIRLPNESLFVSSDFVTRLLAIFALSHPSPATAFRTCCARLHTRADFRDEGSDLLDSLGKFDLDSDVGLNKLLRKYPTGYLAIRLVKLEIIFGADVDSLHRLLDICNSGAYCKSVSDLCVNGNDLASLGFRGREIGLALNDLLDAVIERRVKNSKDRLLAYASKMKEK
jgi:tRNA nucleotidyltransferase (CCA-adding enzyme)